MCYRCFPSLSPCFCLSLLLQLESCPFHSSVCLSSTCESEQTESKEREEEEKKRKKKEKKKERTGGGKMKSAPHGASGGALWNAVSEGRMKALVTSHRTNARTHMQAHTTWLRCSGDTQPRWAELWKEESAKGMKKKKEEQARRSHRVGCFILTHICPDA